MNSDVPTLRDQGFRMADAWIQNRGDFPPQLTPLANNARFQDPAPAIRIAEGIIAVSNDPPPFQRFKIQFAGYPKWAW